MILSKKSHQSIHHIDYTMTAFLCHRAKGTLRKGEKREYKEHEGTGNHTIVAVVNGVDGGVPALGVI
jgi:hypothetical protein